MPDPACRACGSPVTLAKLPNGDTIELETHTEPTGPNRYRITSFVKPLQVEPVPDDRQINAYPAHANDCPAGGNGLVR